MSKCKEISEKMNRKIKTDNAYVTQLQNSPSAVFRQEGIHIPEGKDEEFKQYMQSTAPGFLNSFVEKDSDDGCAVCKAAAYSTVVALAVVGYTGLGTLTATSSVVLLAVDALGFEATEVVAAMQGLTAGAFIGLSFLASDLCTLLKAC